MKTGEDLNALREEVVTLHKKLSELTEEELKQVTGGVEILVPEPIVVRAFGCESGRMCITCPNFPQP